MNFSIDTNAVAGMVVVLLGGLVYFVAAWFQSRGKLVRANADLDAAKIEREKQRVDDEKAAAKRDAEYTAKLDQINERLSATNKELQQTTISLTGQISFLQGSLDSERRVQGVLETRIQRAEEERYKAYGVLNDTERELKIAQDALKENIDALKKANDLNQSYQTTIKKLEADVEKLTERVTQLETDQKAQAERNAALHRDYSSVRYALRRYVELVPLKSTPPEFQADLAAHGVDLGVLLADPLTIHEAPKELPQQVAQEAIAGANLVG